MTSSATAPVIRLAPHAGPPPFRRVLCGVNAGRHAHEAVREALVLAAGGAELRFLAISDQVGTGPTRTALLSPRRADLALDEARALAREAGVAATADRVADRDVTGRLLEEARDHDVLVVGCPIHSRTPGILVGETAAVALHRAAVPLLLARMPHDGLPFPARVVVATDATSATREAVTTGARLAQRHGVPLLLLHVADARGASEHHELALQTTSAREIGGAEPIVLCESGKTVARILEVADGEDGTLTVLGSAGRRGLEALGSVSERVAAHARGPVLVLRHR